MADDGEATVQAVADHVEHIAQVAGKRQCVLSAVGSLGNLNSCVHVVSVSGVTLTVSAAPQMAWKTSPSILLSYALSVAC